MVTRTPAISQDDYVQFCNAVRRLTALDLLQYRRPQMERRIRSLARRRGFGDDLVRYATSLRASEQERAVLLEHVTINVSQLWRNPKQWNQLLREVFPHLAAARTMRAWSAGCSYGAEPYTLAALCREHLPDVHTHIHATDIDAAILERARQGEFAKQDMTDVPSRYLTRWFEQLPDGRWRASRELRRAVTFEQADVTTQNVRASSYDLILCRNLVIYLDPSARRVVHGTLARSLRPGGFLMVGATERIPGYQEHGLEHPHPFLYRRARHV